MLECNLWWVYSWMWQALCAEPHRVTVKYTTGGPVGLQEVQKGRVWASQSGDDMFGAAQSRWGSTRPGVMSTAGEICLCLIRYCEGILLL